MCKRLPFIPWSIAGVPSSQALPGYLITVPPSMCVPDVIGALTVWIQKHNKVKIERRLFGAGKKNCNPCTKKKNALIKNLETSVTLEKMSNYIKLKVCEKDFRQKMSFPLRVHVCSEVLFLKSSAICESVFLKDCHLP